MTLAMDQVLRQLPGVIEQQRARDAGIEVAVHNARRALDDWAADPEVADARIAAAMERDSRPYALSAGEPVTAAFDPPARGPVTVVASDGSSIEPDRFSPISCFVVNVGLVALPYGVRGEVHFSSSPLVGPIELAGAEEGADAGRDEQVAFGWGVNLQRDARELERGATAAIDRLAFGAVTLLVDGTLLPWDLDSRQVSGEVRTYAVNVTQESLDRLRDSGEGLSMGAYVSGSRSSDVVTSLRALGVGPIPGALGSDGRLFARILADGQRSAVFRARSERATRVEALFRPAHEVAFFYLRVLGDVARVEVPAWAADEVRIARLHAVLVDQCARNGGYPRALQEAHELAVISGADRLQFQQVLEASALRQGYRTPVTGKQMSKRRRAV